MIAIIMIVITLAVIAVKMQNMMIMIIIRTVHLLRVSLLRVLESNFPIDSKLIVVIIVKFSDSLRLSRHIY